MITTKDIGKTPFDLAVDFIRYTNAAVFLTGKAGTGKTTFLKYIKDNEIKNTAIVAPTGVAAINAGGTTIHSFFQLPFGPYIPVGKGFAANDRINDKHGLISRLRLSNEHKKVMQALDLLIIDEISMVRCDVLDAIDAVLKHVRNQHSKPFGGVQLLLIGDMYQLSPVKKEEEWQLLSPYYKSPYFFNSLIIESQALVYIELDKVYRQSDGDFINLLNQVRNDILDKEGYELLHSRYLPEMRPDKEENFITLTTHNNKADVINLKELNDLPGKLQTFIAFIEGEFYEKSYPAETTLQLKIGAQVMFIKNDTEKVRRYYNGKIGIVQKIDDDKIFIQCKNEDAPIEVKKEKWKNIRYSVDKANNNIEETEVGSFTQFPLRLAWAITIHKSQGLSFEKAIIDAGDAFSTGQVYVALSRCTNLKGIILKSRIDRQSLVGDQRIIEFTKKRPSPANQLTLLEEAKHGFQKTVVLDLFDFAEIRLAASKFFDLIVGGKKAFNDEAAPWAEAISIMFNKMEMVAKKFLPQLEILLAQPLLPEQNINLQNRIIAAIDHFCPILENALQQINKCPAITDNKTISIKSNDGLLDLYQQACIRLHLLSGCKDGVLINNFLLLKRQFVTPRLNINMYAGKSSYIQTDSPHPELYKQLRKKRDELCEEKKTPIYLVANTATLDEMARYLPLTPDDLSRISGFGKVKIQQFGNLFLQIINAYCEENNFYTNIGAKPLKPKRIEKVKEIKIDTKTTSYLLFKEGKSITEIAQERNMVRSTIEGHLSYFIGSGEIDLDLIIPLQKQALIKDAIEQHGRESLKKIIENISGDISYGEVRMVLASLKNT